MASIGRRDPLSPVAEDGLHAAPKTPDSPARSWHHWLGIPLVIYAITRLAQIAAIAWLDPAGASVYDRLLSWDAGWFIRVARDGYPHTYTHDASGHLTANELAFFPLYPMLIRAGHAVGFSYGGAALCVSWIAGGVGAVLLFRLTQRLWPQPMVGYALVALFCAQPMSVVLSMGYSESLFVALVAGMLLAAREHRWLLAGVLGALAGLTRPTGAAAAVALAVAVGIRIFGRTQTPRPSPREIASATTAAVLALAAVPAYIGWVGWRVGDPGAWFKIQQAGWGTRFDFGHSVWDFIFTSLRSDGGWVAISVALLLIAATVALLVALRRKIWPPFVVYGVISFVLVVGQAGYFHSKPRLLVPVLLILLPGALAAARARPRSASLWLIAYAAFGIWYGAYMITVWPYAI
jgi:Mannosyltransferase (PIG-V)